MKNQWNKDLDFSEKMVSLVDQMLLFKIPNIEEINRLKTKEGRVHELDKHYAIDGEIIKKTGIRYTFQEKIRRNKFKRYDDFTLEYLSNVNTGEKGEFFHLSSDFYLHGYSNESEDKIERLRIINVMQLKKYIDLNFNALLNKNLKQNKAHSNANFFTINFDKLEKEGNIVIADFKIVEELKLNNKRKGRKFR